MNDKGEWWIGRADGELMGEYAWVSGSDGPEPDWSPAEDDAEWGSVEYIARRMVVVEERRRTLPTCSLCDEPATYWGLCEPHAREDDPDSFTEASESTERPATGQETDAA